MTAPQISTLSGGRLHLHHGPIDLILWAEGPDRAQAYRQAIARFNGVLSELVAELPLLRSAAADGLTGAIAQKMGRAVAPFRPEFITPMAAVAGAVADEILRAMTCGLYLTRAYVNNGGDIALHLTPGQSLVSAIALPDGNQNRVTLHYDQPARGLASSGWRGRSFSRGIADTVTVVARTAALADAAATMIANAVDLPGHPGISRRPADQLQSDSDLGQLLVTTAVTALSHDHVARALTNGAEKAALYQNRQLIAGAALFLQSDCQSLGLLCLEKEPALV